MSELSHALAIDANRGGAKLGTTLTKTGSIQAAISDQFHCLFPTKTWGKVSEILGLSKSVAKRRLTGARPFTADELAQLIRSEQGFDFLVAVMRGHQPKWWRLCVPLMEVAEVQRLQAAARRRLRRAVQGALDADRDITAALSRADAFSDQDFHRPHLDALRAVAGVPDSAMASPTKRGRA